MGPEDKLKRVVVVARDLPWVTEMVMGPALQGFDDFAGYVEATAAFLERADTPACGAVARYWLAHCRTHGAFPAYHGNWRRQLAPVVGNVAVRERRAPGEPSRYRYVGVGINEMTGVDMTGKCITEFLPLPLPDLLEIERMVHDECRSCLTRRDYRNIDKADLTALALNLVFADRDGVPRFNMTVGDYDIAI